MQPFKCSYEYHISFACYSGGGRRYSWVVEQVSSVLAQNVDAQSSSEFHFNGGKRFPPNKLGRVHDIMVLKSNCSGKQRMSYE